jgi:broad specificity phosphatase PhoE
MASGNPKWPEHLVIVRHAESERNIWKDIAYAKGELVYGGKIRDMDVELTENGKKQAAATGQAIGKEFHFDRVFASPFVRTTQTAQIMVEQFPYEVETMEEERLREIDFGILDGLTKYGVKHRHPDEAARREKLKKYYYRPPAGENWPDVALRIHTFLGTLTREAAGESVLVVCHSVVVLVFRKLLERFSEGDLLAIDKKDVENCSVTHYAFDPNYGKNGKLVLRCYNRICYADELKKHSSAG